MKPERALVFNVGPNDAITASLLGTLTADFDVAPPINNPALDGANVAQIESDIGRAVRESEPRLIFLVTSGNELRESKLLLSFIKKTANHIPVIATIRSASAQDAVELLSAGAADFVTTPFTATDVLPRAQRLVQTVFGDLPSEPAAEYQKQLIGESPSFRTEVQKIPLIAGCDANVLIVGETGTGKELYARAIHYSSARVGQPFMPVNCGAIPVELVENELFGHTRGAYTSANTLQIGLIEEANGGTLFLDEIDCLPIFAQVKLLRFLQEKEYRPLGSPRMRRADVRIIAASNLNMPEAVDNGRVRQDLFYRLNIISLTLPPLRDRREDIPLLARHFLSVYSRASEKQILNFTSEALNLLLVHNWPGNVRELEHVVERAVVLCQSNIIEAKDLLISNSQYEGHRESLQEAKAREIARFEKNYIQGVLSACRGNITRAAQVAQKNRRAFWQLIQKHQIDVNRFKPSSP